MALNIRNSEAEELAARLARLTGETKTRAVTEALRERLKRLQAGRDCGLVVRELDELVSYAATLTVHDDRSADQIIGYDEHGLPDGD